MRKYVMQDIVCVDVDRDILVTECLQALATGIGKKSKGKGAPVVGTCVFFNMAKTTNAVFNGNYCGETACVLRSL